ncbi:uncharacterized protein LOC143898274 isoform X3 [Temnothorax americanus]|uniref:uncharacterized protein LOC143898274 isoform X3 n=1 Tax=Temnothorax americanus TaxID=1964332 RepID=UPI004068C408
MSDDTLKCVFCGQNKLGKIVKFTPVTIKKCLAVLEYRRSKPVLRKSRTTYDNVELSAENSLNEGYHSQCYKLFTAIKIPHNFPNLEQQESAAECDNAPEVSGESSESAGVSSNFERDFEGLDDTFRTDEPVSNENLPSVKCFICERTRKRQHGREVPLAVNRFRTIDLLKSAATEYNDINMLEKISSFSDDSNITYHKCCKDQYLRDISREKDNEFFKKREALNFAYIMLCEMLEENVVKNNECLFFDHVKKEYQKLLIEQSRLLSDSVSSTSFSDRHLERKLMDTFDRKIKIIYAEKKKFLAPFSACILTYKDLFKTMVMKETIRSVAIQLREEILNSTRKKLAEDCTAEDLITGECDYVPELLTCFLETLIWGDVSHRSKEIRENKNYNKELAIFSLGQDLIYAASSHKIKTSKHITLGLAVKSLCNSKKIINILSKYGHCCSYITLEELETEMTFSTTNSTYVCPEDILRRPDLNTGVAFDNFDRFVETLNGKDTLHDMVGIIYQDVIQNEDTMSVVSPNVCENKNLTTNKTVHSNFSESSMITTKRKRKRRSFDEITFVMHPFTKKLKITTWNQLDISELNQTPDSLMMSKQLDVAWMLLHMHRISDVPMWVGYHSKILIDDSPVQKVSYLTPINDSPTNNSTVLKTLELSQAVASECQTPYIQITYDLAIARISYCIQAQESPKFDNIFIHLGAFHIEMAFFKAVGTFIDECGLSHIMSDCNLIANGSVAGFIAGKNYNRCKRLHSQMALVLQQLHFESFLENKHLTIQESVSEYLTTFMQHKDISPQVQHTETQHLIQSYDQYTADTLEGKHGKTAQFYAMYIDFINLYHIFIKSIRVGDLDLYLNALGKIVNLFFYYNQQNYSRWLVYYINQLQHVDKTHPGLRAEIAKGSFGIRKTVKPFSRIPVDLTLEQTINGDAARRLTGIVNLTNSIAARQRWARNHGARTRIISHVLTRAGLNRSHQDIAADLHPDRIKKHRKQIEAFLHSIQQTINPFSSSIDKNQLYNISTGQATTPEIANSLLNAVSAGTLLRDQFITECNINSDRFHQPLKKNPVLTFASLKKKKKMKIGQKIHEVKLQRDLFGRLLALSLDTNIDLEKMLCFPITPVPLSLCHIDGSLNKTVKSVLVKELEKKIEEMELPPSNVDFVIVDGFFFLNTLKEMPRSFGDVSKKILQCLVNNSASRIAIVFDRYFTPSIKDYEHTLRGSVDDKDFYISGPQQTRTADFAKDLKNIKFKEALVKFFIDHWANQEMATIIDIVVIMLANMEHLQALVKIWMDLGVSNARRYIDVSALSAKLGPIVSRALPALHALTGCDFNPAFYRRGKKKPLDILMNSEIFQKEFADLGSKDYNIDESFNIIQSFICHLYGLKKLDDVNRARIEIFNKTYKVSDTSQPFSLNVRNYDASCLPPCQSELLQQLLRTRYIACLWRNAHNPNSIDMSPTDYGWTDVKGKLEMTWFVGNQLPEAYDDVVITPDILGDTPDSDMQAEDEFDEQIEPDLQYDDSSTDEDED